ncbi:hypothetical protein [Mycoplasmopsis gallinacea]|nr:hypothetical protein [Mycoplasmopsis gallinacea]
MSFKLKIYILDKILIDKGVTMGVFKITTHKKMSYYEERKAQIIAGIIRFWNKRTNKELARMYHVSVRTIIRYKQEIKPFIENGTFNVAHKGRKNENALKYNDETINKIMCDYYDFSEEFFPKKATINTAPFWLYYYEKVKQSFNISYSQAFRRVKKQGFINIQMTRKGKRESRKIRRLLEQEIGEKTSLFTRIGSLEIDEREKKRKSVYQAKNIHLKFGENVELDACQEIFFGDKKVFIYHAIDSATGKLLELQCEEQETNVGYQKLIDKLFKKYGFPSNITTDRRRTFWGSEKTYTMFEEALIDRGITLFVSSNPKDKPNVERSFASAQNYYPYLFKNKGIDSIEKLNKRSEEIIDEYNRHFQKTEGNKESKFIKNDPSSNIYDFSLRIRRRVNNGVVMYKNKMLAPYDEHNKRLMFFSQSGKDINLCLDVNQNLYFEINNKKYIAKVVEESELNETEIYALAKGLDISIPQVHVIAKAIVNSRKFTLAQSQLRHFPDEILKNENAQKIIKILERSEEILLKLYNLLEKDIEWKDKVAFIDN